MYSIVGSYWVWVGTIYLIILTIQDYIWKMKIDDRMNYLIIGVTLSLASHYTTRLIYIAILIGVIIIFYFVINKLIKNLGQGDLKAITWILTGFAIINIYYMPMFLLVFGLIYAFYAIVKLSIRRLLLWKGIETENKAPFFSVILISFIAFSILYGLY